MDVIQTANLVRAAVGDLPETIKLMIDTFNTAARELLQYEASLLGISIMSADRKTKQVTHAHVVGCVLDFFLHQ